MNLVIWLPERYKEKIIVDNKRGCWLWQGEKNQKGYGRGWFQNKRYVAHRLLYWLCHGEKVFNLDDLSIELDHLCEVRNCVNPEHMEKVSHQVNMKRISRRRKKITDDGCLAS